MNDKLKTFFDEESDDILFSKLDSIAQTMSMEHQQEYFKLREEATFFKNRLRAEVKKKCKELLRAMPLSVKKGSAYDKKLMELVEKADLMGVFQGKTRC